MRTFILAIFILGIISCSAQKQFDYAIVDQNGIDLAYIVNDSAIVKRHYFESGIYYNKIDHKELASNFLKNTSKNLIYKRDLKYVSKEDVYKEFRSKRLVTEVNYDKFNSYFFENEILIYHEDGGLTEKEENEFIDERNEVYLGSYVLKYIDDYPFLFLLNNHGDSYTILPFFKKENPFVLGHKKYSDSQKNKLLVALSYKNLTVVGSKNKYGLYINYDYPRKESVRLKELLPPIYDTIQLAKPIITKKNKTFTLYNALGEKYPIEGVRAAFYFEGLGVMRTLQNNNLFWIDEVGKKITKKIHLGIPLGVGELPDFDYHFDMIKSQDSLFVSFLKTRYNPNKKRRNIYDTYDTLDIKKTALFSRKDVDSAFFLLRKFRTYKNDSKEELKTGNEDVRFIITKNSYGYTVYKANYTTDSQINASLEKKILTNLSKKPKGYYYPRVILIEKNNLKGYYPFVTEPKYKKLSEFEFCYARFTLLNGKKGWLDIYGNEYLDE